MTMGRGVDRRAQALLVENALDITFDEETEWMLRTGIREHEMLERIERPARG